MTVEVKKNTDGELVASVRKIQKVKDGQTTDVAEVEFVNTEYTAAGSLSLRGSKKLTGAELKAGMFKFNLTGTGLEEAVEKLNGADGKIDFGTIASWKGTEDKEFTFNVSEVNDSQPGYTYDGKVYTVNVKAAFDNSSKTYSYVLEEGTTDGVTIDEKTGAIALPEKSFTNTYYEEGSVNLKATKDFSGTTWKDETFKFVLTAGSADAGEVTTSPMPEGTVDGSKTVTVTKDSSTDCTDRIPAQKKKQIS